MARVGARVAAAPPTAARACRPRGSSRSAAGGAARPAAAGPPAAAAAVWPAAAAGLAATARLPRGARLACAAKKQKFASFGEMLSKSEVPVLVDFYATWCGPCQMAAQALDALGPAFNGRCLFVRIDTEKYPRLAAAYGVQALPTLVLFRDNAPAARLDGFLPEPELRRWLEGALAPR